MVPTNLIFAQQNSFLVSLVKNLVKCRRKLTLLWVKAREYGVGGEHVINMVARRNIALLNIFQG